MEWDIESGEISGGVVLNYSFILVLKVLALVVFELLV